MAILPYDNNFFVQLNPVKTTACRSGFMLIEIMLAFVLLCAVALVIAQYQLRCTHNNQLAHDMIQATTMARATLENAMHNSLKDSMVQIGKFSVSTTVHSYIAKDSIAHPFAIDATKKLKHMVVKVAWRDALRGEHHVILGSATSML